MAVALQNQEGPAAPNHECIAQDDALHGAPPDPAEHGGAPSRATCRTDAAQYLSLEALDEDTPEGWRYLKALCDPHMLGRPHVTHGMGRMIGCMGGLDEMDG